MPVGKYRLNSSLNKMISYLIRLILKVGKISHVVSYTLLKILPKTPL